MLHSDILKLLYKYCDKKVVTQLYKTNKTFFEEQVISFLKNKLPNLKIKTQYQHEGINLPIAIFNEHGNIRKPDNAGGGNIFENLEKMPQKPSKYF